MNLADNGLDDDLVAVNSHLVNRVLDIVGELFRKELGLLVIISLLIFQMLLHNLLDACLYLGRIKTLRFLRLELVSVLSVSWSKGVHIFII